MASNEDTFMKLNKVNKEELHLKIKEYIDNFDTKFKEAQINKIKEFKSFDTEANKLDKLFV